ncbi:MAG: hypothetical protein COB02_14710 [Candidatus Cloacimonadota bacterium]|nr:MAG: hypothetical protein COB02_14710 [Candidatus Cloacimonadota bacterium]
MQESLILKYTITTPKLILKPLSSLDISKLFKMSLESGIKDWMPDQVYQNEDEAKKAIEDLNSFLIQEINPSQGPIVLGVYLHNNRLIGHVGLSPVQEGVEIGYAIEDSEQKKGYATEAVEFFTKWGLQKYSLHFILGIVDSNNINSCKVLEKCGYIFGETKKDQKIYKKV